MDPYTGKQENRDGYRRVRSSSRQTLLLSVLLIAGVIVWTMIRQPGSISFNLGEDAMGVSGTDADTVFLYYADIREAVLEDSLDYSSPVQETVTDSTRIGIYRTDRYGEVRVFAWTSCETVIVVVSDDLTVAFNCKSRDETGEQFTALQAKL